MSELRKKYSINLKSHNPKEESGKLLKNIHSKISHAFNKIDP